jgi:hypothetical protein
VGTGVLLPTDVGKKAQIATELQSRLLSIQSSIQASCCIFFPEATSTNMGSSWVGASKPYPQMYPPLSGEQGEAKILGKALTTTGLDNNSN